jgi:hypothetical protein
MLHKSIKGVLIKKKLIKEVIVLKNQAIFLFCLVSLLISGCQYKKEPLNIYRGESFTIEYPKEVTLAKLDMKKDFYIISFKYKRNNILNVYVGNHPSLDIDKERANDIVESRGEINGLPYISYNYWVNKGKVSKAMLVTLPDSIEWPSYLHIWYINITEKDSYISKKIISSVRVSKN